MKSQRAYQFLVVLLLILPARIFSQQEIPRIEQKNPHVEGISVLFYSKSQQKQVSGNQKKACPLTEKDFLHGLHSPNEFSERSVLRVTVSPNFYPANLPFFCKKEFQFERNTSIPLRLRLGSLDYVNRMEGKK